MDSFGEYLSRERELRGVTLEEIAKFSNISIRYLKAIEADDYDALPAEVFVKGFLRCYAESTGMDPSEVLLAYDSFAAKRRAEQGLDEELEPEEKSNAKWFILLAIVIVVVASFLIFYFSTGEKKVEPLSVSSDEINTEVTGEIKKEIDEIVDPLPEPPIPEEEESVELEGNLEEEPQEISTDKELTSPGEMNTSKEVEKKKILKQPPT